MEVMVIKVQLTFRFRAAYKLLFVKWQMTTLRRNRMTVAQVFQQFVKKHPEKVMFICGEKSYTYRDVESYSNQIAQYFLSQGFR